MNKVNDKIGTDYKLFNYYGAPDAENVIIAMGSVCDTIEETIDYLNANGDKVRPGQGQTVPPVLRETPDRLRFPRPSRHISVLDRTKEPGSIGEPLYLDVVAALKDSKFESIPVFTGRYGLGSKDTTPAQHHRCVLKMLRPRRSSASPSASRTMSPTCPCDVEENPDTTPEGTTSCKFWGLGADGTVGANKNSIKIIGDHTDMYAQAYFAYDSKKSGGVTISHLRFGHKPDQIHLLSSTRQTSSPATTPPTSTSTIWSRI